MKKRNIKIAALTLSLVAAIGAGSALAYLSDTDSKINTFTVGQVKVTQEEPNFPETPPTNVVPGQEINKDPQVTNNGKNTCFVFEKFTIPYQDWKVASADGQIADSALVPMFYTIKADGTDGINDGWTLVKEKVESDGSHTYVYGYGTADKMTELAVGKTTTPLFNKVRLQNIAVTDGSSNPRTYEIPVETYAIQSTWLEVENGQAKTSPADVWKIVSNQHIDTLKNYQ